MNTDNKHTAEENSFLERYPDSKHEIREEYTEAFKLKGQIAELQSHLSEITRERDGLLRLNHAWPLKDVLNKMIDAAHILLHKKDYDGHGWEEIQAAFIEAQIIHTLLASLTPMSKNEDKTDTKTGYVEPANIEEPKQ